MESQENGGINIKDFIVELKDKDGKYSSMQDFERGFSKVVGVMDFNDYKDVNNIYPVGNFSQLKKLKYKYFKDNEFEYDEMGLSQSKNNFIKAMETLGYYLFFDRVKKDKRLVNLKYPTMSQVGLFQKLEKDLAYLDFNGKKLIKDFAFEIVEENIDSVFYYRLANSIVEDDGEVHLEVLVEAIKLEFPYYDKEALKKIILLFILQIIAASDGAIHSTHEDKINCYELVLVFVGDGGVGKSKLPYRMFDQLGELEYYQGQVIPDIKEDGKNQHLILTYLLVEASEFDTLTNSIKLEPQLKNFFSKTNDTVFKTGTYKGVSFPRSTTFFATTNQVEYLGSDNTRREISLAVLDIDQNIIRNVNFKSIFKYAHKKYLEGHKWWLDEKEDAELMEMIKNANIRHHQNGWYKVLVQRLLKMILDNKDYSMGNKPVGAEKIYIALTGEQPTKKAVKDLASALQEIDVFVKLRNADSTYKLPGFIDKLYQENFVKIVEKG